MAGAAAGQGREACNLNTWLQGVMYHWVAVPVLKARWAVIGQSSCNVVSLLNIFSGFTVFFF